MKKYNVGILGVTGAVGQEMLKVLMERDFPVENLRVFASEKSAGKKIKFKEKEYIIEKAEEGIFKGLDIIFGAVENDLAVKLIPSAVKDGAVVIDNSSAYRLNDDVPLVVPEVNPDDVEKHKGIIANPNCATIIGLVTVNGLNRYNKIKRMIVSTYQAVSGAGAQGITELDKEIKALSEKRDFQVEVFPYQIAYNLIPQIGNFDETGYSAEELKFQNEGRKILNNKELKVNCTCVRVPVYRSHSESITIEFENDIDVETAKDLLNKTEGVKFVDNPAEKKYPMPLDSSDQDLVYVGRVRKDMSRDDNKGLTLWCCGDQVRKGAASNAVQIGEILIKKDLIKK